MTDEQRESLTHTVRAALEGYFLLDEPKVFKIELYMRRLADYVVLQIETHEYIQALVRSRTPTKETIDSMRLQLETLRKEEQEDFEATGRGHRSKQRAILHSRLNPDAHR